jgi:hypothetical protein
MTKYALALLAAVTLTQPVLSVAADRPSSCDSKTSSFVPHARTSNHVYGTPIQPAIVGHGRSSHRNRNHTPKKRSSSAAKK